MSSLSQDPDRLRPFLPLHPLVCCHCCPLSGDNWRTRLRCGEFILFCFVIFIIWIILSFFCSIDQGRQWINVGSWLGGYWRIAASGLFLGVDWWIAAYHSPSTATPLPPALSALANKKKGNTIMMLIVIILPPALNKILFTLATLLPLSLYLYHLSLSICCPLYKAPTPTIRYFIVGHDRTSLSHHLSLYHPPLQHLLISLSHYLSLYGTLLYSTTNHCFLSTELKSRWSCYDDDARLCNVSIAGQREICFPIKKRASSIRVMKDGEWLNCSSKMNNIEKLQYHHNHYYLCCVAIQ